MTPATSPGNPTGRLPLVDSLRAIAALSIFAYHALFVTGNLAPGNYGWYLNFGVPLFYGISGLLLWRPFATAMIARRPLPRTGDYLRRRVFRIVPAYWIALPLVAVMLDRMAQVFTLKGVPTYFGFLQAYSLDTFSGGIGQAWTLCVEAAFYLFLPVLAVVASRLCRGSEGPRAVAVRLLVLIALLAVLSLVWKIAVVSWVGGDVQAALVPLTALPAALDQFAVGMGLAVLIAFRSAEGGRSPGLPGGPLAYVAVAVFAYLLIGEVYGVGPVGNGLPGGWGARDIAEHELKALVTFGLLVAATASSPGRGSVGRVLGFRPLTWAGEVSYGVYLWHLMVLIVLAGSASMGPQVHWLGHDGGLVGGLPGVAVALGVTLLLGAASWLLIERPLVSRSHRPRQ